MADVSNVAVITINKTTAPLDRAAFGTPIFVTQVDVATQASRVGLYNTVKDLTDAGFAATSEAVKWATVVKAQERPPTRLAIGRRVPGTQQVDDVEITTADVGTWTITIDTIVYSYVAGASDTEETIAEGLRLAVETGNPALTDVLVPTAITTGPAAFTVTARVGGTPFVNGGIVVPGAGAGTFVNSVANAAAEAMATALTAINTENSKDWFVMTTESREDADISALQTFISPLDKIGIAQSSDSDALGGTTPNIFDTISALNPVDFGMFWHDDDREYLDAGVAALVAAAQMDNQDGQITLNGKQIVGVPTDDLTATQINNIAGDLESSTGFGGNVYVPIGGRGFLAPGRAPSGEFIDIEMTNIWMKSRLSEDVFGVIATTPTKIPGTNAGIGIIAGQALKRANIGIRNGHFDGDFEPELSFPTTADRSDSDKANRVLRNVIVRVRYSGAIHKAFLEVRVNA